MYRITKILNHNTVLALNQEDNRENLVMGKGVGFGRKPGERVDFTPDATVYQLSQKCDRGNPRDLIKRIDPLYLNIANAIILDAKNTFGQVDTSILIPMADHIAFAIERCRRGIYVRMPNIYELELNYPAEVKIGRQLVEAIQKEFKIRLPKGEVQGIAMHLINARDGAKEQPALDLDEKYEEILDQTTRIIEREMGFQVRRDTFNYARFATHMQFLLKRAFEHKPIDSSNLQMYASMREEYPEVSACVDQISRYYRTAWSLDLTDEEKLYLILHVNRVCSKEDDR